MYRIFTEEGLLAFWKGHVPAQGLSILFGVGQFLTFEVTTKTIHSVCPQVIESDFLRPWSHFVSGAVSGVSGTVLAYPLDVIRTRLVAQGNSKLYLGTLDAVKKMYLQEGPKAYFRGLVPTFCTIAPYSGLQFGFYNLFTQILGSQDNDKVISMSKSALCGALAGNKYTLL